MATDFFSHLLDRALEQAPVLQRRRPSLFEPTDAAGVSPALMGKAGGYGEEEPTAEMELWEVRDAPAFQPTTAMPRRAAARSVMPIPESTGLDSVRAEEPMRPVTPTGSEARQESRRETTPPSRPAQATPQSVRVVASSVVETIVEKEVEKPWPAIRSAHPSEGRTITPVVVAPLSPSPVRPVVVPTSRRDQPSETRATPREVSRKREMEAASARPAQAAAPSSAPLPHLPFPVVRSPSVPVREAPPPAPTIQVTIGRIEVRATPPAAAPARAARSATPRLSLEDYLRSRSGGAK